MPSRGEACELLIGPAGELIIYLTEEMRFAGLAQKGIYALSILPTLLDVAESYTAFVAPSRQLPWREIRAVRF